MSEDFKRWVDTARMLMDRDIECRSWMSQINHKNDEIKNLTRMLTDCRQRCERRQTAVSRREAIIVHLTEYINAQRDKEIA